MRQSAAIRMLTLPYAGLDQFNRSPIPRSLAGRGEVAIVVTMDGKSARTVTINTKQPGTR
jgi:hypothetical protein